MNRYGIVAARTNRRNSPPAVVVAALTLAAIVAFAPLAAFAQPSCINVRLAPYNAVGDGSHDDAPAINAAFAAGQANGVPVCIPSAQIGSFYRLATNLNPVTAPLTVLGDSPYTSVLGSNATTGDALTLAGPNIIVRNLGMADIIAKTSGALIKLTSACSSCVVDTWYMPFPYVGIDSAASNARITNGDVRFSVSGAGSAGVIFSGGSGTTLTNTSIDVTYLGTPPSPLPVPESGVSVAGAVTGLTIDNVRVHNATVCFRLSQGSGVTIAHSSCDAASVGVRAQPTLGAIDHVTLDTVHVTNTAANGATFAGGGAGTISDIAVNNSTVENAGGYGVAITAGVSGFQLNGGSLSSNAASGFYAAPGVSSWSVQGANLNANAAYGVYASTGAGDLFRVIGNDAHGNGTGAIFNGATGTHTAVAQNIN